MQRRESGIKFLFCSSFGVSVLAMEGYGFERSVYCAEFHAFNARRGISGCSNAGWFSRARKENR
ncbi:exported protein of unknown function [Agrobacterium pusense]|uniref:Uncharacterized protein n=1 Tax=Agrobacterium pusense TaxID=648995 RepID=U4Q507_9HYPH|nr:exported protein of unknown function [Agrobacterium pusense]